ncbi:hypothetical protein [Litorimonas sp. WD9-15]|uniref:hypothetical protein n=1 Tax=Litorimonas sp. WD9-15 TaxID=3418716 RepID=UPI003D083089
MGLFSKTSKYLEYEYMGHRIEVHNWWRMVPTQSAATLIIDDEIIVKNTKWSHINPDIPVLKGSGLSESIKSVEVFMIGMFSMKFALKINGGLVYSEEISRADEWQRKLFGHKTS